ncbi:MAG: PHP domain-containing protein [Anaerolineae bacterium]
MKVDMHVHTCYSKDATLSLETIMESCERRGLDGAAITDHNTIAGALALKEIAPFLVIVGEEIDTTRGEILGLFLKEEIPGGLMPEEAMARIREQGGLVGVSHPLDRLRRSAMRQVALLDILDELDFLEGFNSRVTFPSDNRKAQALAQARGLPITAGSDAHTAYEIGRAYVEMPNFNGREGFLEALKEAQIFGRLSPPWIHLVSTWTKLRRRLSSQR